MKKAQWLFWAKLFIGALIVAVASYQINKRDSILETLQEADWSYVALALVLLIPNIVLSHWKWLYLVRLAEPQANNGRVAGSLFLGYALGMITPGRLGELGRGFYFAPENRATITGLNVLDKAANQVVFLTFGTGGLLGIYWAGNNELLWLIVPSLIAVAIVWFLILFRRVTAGIFNWFSEKLAPGSWFRGLIKSYELLSFANSMVLLLLSFLWTLIIVWQYHLLVLAFAPASLMDSLQAVPAILYAKTMLPFTFGDLGIRESIAVYFYGLLGVASAAVFNASLCIFFINFLLPALVGIYFVFYLRPEIANLRKRSTNRSNR